MRPRKTILCVENNEQVLSVRKFMLETRGYRVVGMTTAPSALEYLEGAMPGSVDLLLADLMMPGMDGSEVSRRLRADPRTADIPIVAMSAAPRLHAMAGLSVNDRLSKPFELDHLYAMVAHWVPVA